MRPQRFVSKLLCLGLLGSLGCQNGLADIQVQEHLGTKQQASVGGGLSIEAHHEAVAAITVFLPPRNPEQPVRVFFRYCTGVLVEDRTVMTSAACLAENLEAVLDEGQANNFLDSQSVKVQFGSSSSASTEYYLDDSFEDGVMSHRGLTLHRYYDSTFVGFNDIALLRLSASPGIEPLPVNGNTLDADVLVGERLEIVGYGKEDASGQPRDDFGIRKVVSPVIKEVSRDYIIAGEDSETTCYADSGGPGLYDFGIGPEIVTVTVLHDECEADIKRQRVDVHAQDFIHPFIKFVSGGCNVEPFCDPCDYDGTCEENCPTRDWDCELGSFAGEGCSRNGDCEQGGRCVPATDDPDFTYCAKPCDEEVTADCPLTMSCQSGECVFEGISPGSQGAPCVRGSDCRSGFCENSLCAYECDASDPAACDSEGGFFCLPSVEDGSTDVCRIDVPTAGGGFCSVPLAGSALRARSTLLFSFGFVLLLGLARRRG